MYKKILVPLDGSELAECALNHVKKIFEGGPAGEVVLLNAVAVELPWRELTADRDGYVKTFINESHKYLTKVQSRLASEGIEARTQTMESYRPASTIVDYAHKHGFDLIVMATHGYTGMKGMMMGSVALKVLHESNVPVLLIRPEACQYKFVSP